MRLVIAGCGALAVAAFMPRCSRGRCCVGSSKPCLECCDVSKRLLQARRFCPLSMARELL
jgi:hypothetical protein